MKSRGSLALIFVLTLCLAPLALANEAAPSLDALLDSEACAADPAIDAEGFEPTAEPLAMSSCINDDFCDETCSYDPDCGEPYCGRWFVLICGGDHDCPGDQRCVNDCCTDR